MPSRTKKAVVLAFLVACGNDYSSADQDAGPLASAATSTPWTIRFDEVLVQID